MPGSCSTNDPSAHSGFGHVQRRFRHRRRTGRPNAGKSTNTTALWPLDHTEPPHTTRRPGLAGPDHHLQRPVPDVVDPHQINLAQAHQLLAHARRISFHRGPPASDVIAELRLWRTPLHFWWIPTPPGSSPTPHSFPKSPFRTAWDHRQHLPLSPHATTVTYRSRRRIDVSSTSSTPRGRVRRRWATLSSGLLPTS